MSSELTTFLADEEVLCIYGAGGHGRVVADSAVRMGVKSIVFIDDKPAVSRLQGWPVRPARELPEGFWRRTRFLVAIGSNAIRERVFAHLISEEGEPFTVIDPGARISPYAFLGRGVFVGAGALINAGAQIGDNCIVNTAASVDHDCVIDTHSQVSPHACLTGAVCLGEAVMIGAGAILTPGRRIGDRTVVGAGAVVTRDLPAGIRAWGVPARIIPS